MMDKKYEDYAKTFEKIFCGTTPTEELEEEKNRQELDSTLMNNTSIADYVWLPLRFEGDMVRIDWLDEWRVEDYD